MVKCNGTLKVDDAEEPIGAPFASIKNTLTENPSIVEPAPGTDAGVKPESVRDAWEVHVCESISTVWPRLSL
jgi:hypothetical protein